MSVSLAGMFLKQLAGYFLRGALVLVPIAATLYIIWLMLKTMDDIVQVGIPGVGLLLTVILITLVGFLTSNVLGRTALDAMEGVFTRLPLVKLLYSSIKDLIGAFVGEKKRFDRPVAVSVVPGSTAKILGFITRDSLHVLGLHGQVAVYVPQSYNFAGNLVIVPRDQVEVLQTPSAELMTFIVSGGISGFGVGESLPPPPPAVPSGAR
jgi:uncharacterized membrane protein